MEEVQLGVGTDVCALEEGALGRSREVEREETMGGEMRLR